jgi:RNA polymerase sigma-70 factor (ECF subfamily)
LLRLGVPAHALPDVVQDTLLLVHRRQADFRGDSSVRTWIFGVVLRVASNYRRKARRSGAVFQQVDRVDLERSPSDAPSPFEQLERRIASELLQRLLDELPGELRDAFVLVELEELSIERAATTLGIRASTCKSRLRTARRLFDAAVGRERARRQRRPGVE